MIVVSAKFSERKGMLTGAAFFLPTCHDCSGTVLIPARRSTEKARLALHPFYLWPGRALVEGRTHDTVEDRSYEMASFRWFLE